MLLIITSKPLPQSSLLAHHYDPLPGSSKEIKIALYIKCDALFLEEQLKKFTAKDIPVTVFM
jgi:hypothetical protein